jgi:hypothetical protein
MSVVERTAVDWLLTSSEPAVRFLARRDLLDEDAKDDAAQILDGRIVRTLLAGPDDVHPYKKWTGAHWRLVSLVELAIPPGEPRAVAAAGRVLDWLCGDSHRRSVQVIDGLARRCASQEGNAIAVCARLGLADDERVELLARSLVEWQWPDGGWNCDKRASGRSSSFHESCPPMWGLHEYAEATGADWARDAALRAAEMFLAKRLFRSPRTGEVLRRSYLDLRYPPFWHYDVLQGLLVLSRIGVVRDPRASDALDEVESRRRPGGRWNANGSWWRPPGSNGSNVEIVDWGRGRPSEMVTLNALRVLRAAGRA